MQREPAMFGQPASPTPSQREQALQILARTGIGKANYAPPLFRLLWRLQANCPPPHFLPFWQAALLLGLFLGPSWAGLMWLLSHLLAWPQPSLPILSVAALVIGALFGLSMRFITHMAAANTGCQHGKRSHRPLPPTSEHEHRVQRKTPCSGRGKQGAAA